MGFFRSFMKSVKEDQKAAAAHERAVASAARDKAAQERAAEACIRRACERGGESETGPLLRCI
jgi:hypothetical protein